MPGSPRARSGALQLGSAFEPDKSDDLSSGSARNFQSQLDSVRAGRVEPGFELSSQTGHVWIMYRRWIQNGRGEEVFLEDV
jgi:hypothetical protein